jgi:ATP-dependent protease ClpP protease subunit
MIRVIGEITADTFKQYVADAAKLPVGYAPWEDVVISSPGGDIGYALAMLDEIDYRKRTTFATGICQSAAAVLATAGEGIRKCSMDALFRFIPPEKEWMDVFDEETGIMKPVQKVPDLRYFLHSMLVARLAGRLKTATAEVELYFDGEFISSIRAKELGMIDEVIS